MPARGSDPAAILRAVQGIADGSGRTVVIAGPEASGKSGLLESLLDRLQSAGTTVRRLRATYAERNAAFAAVRPLASDPEEVSDGADGAAPSTNGDSAFVPPEPTSSRRGRGDRQRGRVLGVAYSARSRGIERLDESEYWGQLCRQFSEKAGSKVAIGLEDATYADDASRAFLLYLSSRTRLRPFVLALVLDSSEPSFSAWEEQLVGRPEVDWVRTRESRIDPREANRVSRAIDELRPATRRVLHLTALMGGSVSEVQLARVSRLTFQELADALLPASEGHLVRVDGGRVTIPHPAWINFLPELLGADELRRMHREIADALEAMHPEPSLALRRELAEHQYAAERGPVALRFLLESAELAERLYAFDDVDSLLTKALACVPSLPVADRPSIEAELELFRARSLLFAGRPSDAERSLAEGLDLGLQGRLASGQLEEWLEPMIPALQAVGPRPGLVTALVESVERLRDEGVGAVEALLEVVIAEAELLRGRPEKGWTESHRAGHLARRRPTAPVQALALLAVGLTRASGSVEDRELADRFLRSAGLSFTTLRRPELEQMAVEYRARLLRSQGRADAALSLHLRAIPQLQRNRMPSIELNHELGVAEILLDRGLDPRGLRALRRAHELVDLLHLNPPAPAVPRLWLLEGRKGALSDELGWAREYWTAVVDRSGPPVMESLRAEAGLRLAVLDLLHGHASEASGYFQRATEEGSGISGVAPWDEWRAAIRSLGPKAQSGGGPLDAIIGARNSAS
ncbi:MAG TPA: AAA family ATPase [Thermoplasmata archaeon]|nr:AAA family ATPase [Thermoplasmata archaeon]